MSSQSLKIIGAGLLGLIVAACLGFLALQLVSQPVGLSTVDASAGDELVSKKQTKQKPAGKKKPKDTEKEPKAPVNTTPYVPPSTPDYSGGNDSSSGDESSGSDGDDDSGGDDSGGGDDHGGDDDD